MWNSRALAFVLLALTPVTAVGRSLMAQSGTAQTADPQKPANQPPVPATPTSQTPAPAAEGHAWTGLVDFGVRGTSIDGDSARFERYRDLGDGLFLDRVGARRDTPRWLVEFQGQHVGRRDQRLIANAMSLGRFKAAFMWDQIPMILSRTTRSLFSGIGTGTLAIDDALQTQVQQTPTAIASVFSQFGTPFDTKTRRHIADGAFEYFASEALTLRTNYRHTDRQGTIPFGGSFGHSSLVETPAPTPRSFRVRGRGGVRPRPGASPRRL